MTKQMFFYRKIIPNGVMLNTTCFALSNYTAFCLLCIPLCFPSWVVGQTIDSSNATSAASSSLIRLEDVFEFSDKVRASRSDVPILRLSDVTCQEFEVDDAGKRVGSTQFQSLSSGLLDIGSNSRLNFDVNHLVSPWQNGPAKTIDTKFSGAFDGTAYWMVNRSNTYSGKTYPDQTVIKSAERDPMVHGSIVQLYTSTRLSLHHSLFPPVQSEMRTLDGYLTFFRNALESDSNKRSGFSKFLVERNIPGQPGIIRFVVENPFWYEQIDLDTTRNYALKRYYLRNGTDGKTRKRQCEINVFDFIQVNENYWYPKSGTFFASSPGYFAKSVEYEINVGSAVEVDPKDANFVPNIPDGYYMEDRTKRVSFTVGETRDDIKERLDSSIRVVRERSGGAFDAASRSPVAATTTAPLPPRSIVIWGLAALGTAILIILLAVAIRRRGSALTPIVSGVLILGIASSQAPAQPSKNTAQASKNTTRPPHSVNEPSKSTTQASSFGNLERTYDEPFDESDAIENCAVNVIYQSLKLLRIDCELDDVYDTLTRFAGDAAPLDLTSQIGMDKVKQALETLGASTEAVKYTDAAALINTRKPGDILIVHAEAEATIQNVGNFMVAAFAHDRVFLLDAGRVIEITHGETLAKISPTRLTGAALVVTRPAMPTIELSSRELNLGRFGPSDQFAETRINLKNRGSTPVTVARITGDYGCFIAPETLPTIPANESKSVLIRFDLQKIGGGDVRKQIQIFLAGKKEPEILEVRFTLDRP